MSDRLIVQTVCASFLCYVYYHKLTVSGVFDLLSIVALRPIIAGRWRERGKREGEGEEGRERKVGREREKRGRKRGKTEEGGTRRERGE